MINCRSSFSHLNLSMIFYYIILSKNSSKPHTVPDCLFLDLCLSKTRTEE